MIYVAQQRYQILYVRNNSLLLDKNITIKDLFERLHRFSTTYVQNYSLLKLFEMFDYEAMLINLINPINGIKMFFTQPYSVYEYESAQVQSHIHISF